MYTGNSTGTVIANNVSQPANGSFNFNYNFATQTISNLRISNFGPLKSLGPYSAIVPISGSTYSFSFSNNFAAGQLTGNVFGSGGELPVSNT